MKTELMTQVTNSIFEVMETMFFLTLEKPRGKHRFFSISAHQGRIIAQRGCITLHRGCIRARRACNAALHGLCDN